MAEAPPEAVGGDQGASRATQVRAGVLIRGWEMSQKPRVVVTAIQARPLPDPRRPRGLHRGSPR